MRPFAVPRDALPEAERRFYDAVAAIRRRPVSGPFIVAMNSSPGLAARIAHLGHYFHSRSQADESVPPLRTRAFIALVGSCALTLLRLDGERVRDAVLPRREPSCTVKG